MKKRNTRRKPPTRKSKLTVCPDCRNIVSSKAESCPHCESVLKFSYFENFSDGEKIGRP